jgi:hypothetical protein
MRLGSGAHRVCARLGWLWRRLRFVHRAHWRTDRRRFERTAGRPGDVDRRVPDGEPERHDGVRPGGPRCRLRAVHRGRGPLRGKKCPSRTRSSPVDRTAAAAPTASSRPRSTYRRSQSFRPRRGRPAPARRPDDRLDLGRRDDDVDRPGNRRHESRRQAAGHEDHLGAPLGFGGHDRSPHQLPVGDRPGHLDFRTGQRVAAREGEAAQGTSAVLSAANRPTAPSVTRTRARRAASPSRSSGS